MKLYTFPGAPSPMRVRLYIAEKNADAQVLDVEEVRLQGAELRQPAHLRRNPFGKVPVLEVDQNNFICESLVIAEYLEECCPLPPMFGRTPLERARVRELDRIVELKVFFPLGRYVQATVTQVRNYPEPGIAEHYLGRLSAGLEFLERRLESASPFIAGEHATMADCTLAAILEFARAKGVQVLGDYPAIAAWFQRYRDRPAVRAVFF